MSIFSKLFGGGSGSKESEAVSYEGYSITPNSVKEAHGYRIAATIEKNGKTHEMIRADTYSSLDTAQEAAVTKAKQVIDQLGDSVFR